MTLNNPNKLWSNMLPCSNFPPEIVIKPIQERNGLTWGISTSSWWQCWVWTRKIFPWVRILVVCLWEWPLYFVKNGEGVMRYQVGWKPSPTSRMESCKLVLSETYLGLMEHKPRWVGPCLTHSLWVRLLLLRTFSGGARNKSKHPVRYKNCL